MRSYYNVCPSCGANLDPGEVCECKSIAGRNKLKFKRITTVSEDGQIELRRRVPMYECCVCGRELIEIKEDNHARITN